MKFSHWCCTVYVCRKYCIIVSYLADLNLHWLHFFLIKCFVPLFIYTVSFDFDVHFATPQVIVLIWFWGLIIFAFISKKGFSNLLTVICSVNVCHVIHWCNQVVGQNNYIFKTGVVHILSVLELERKYNHQSTKNIPQAWKGLYKKINANTSGFTQLNMGLDECASIFSSWME